ncbi:MAG: hypothetical protein GY772_20355 [bacterium]|nr:hypothetical protein [bacterium]
MSRYYQRPNRHMREFHDVWAWAAMQCGAPVRTASAPSRSREFMGCPMILVDYTGPDGSQHSDISHLRSTK